MNRAIRYMSAANLFTVRDQQGVERCCLLRELLDAPMSEGTRAAMQRLVDAARDRPGLWIECPPCVGGK